MNNTWVLVCNQEKARIFTKKPFQLVETISNDLGREKNRAFSDDKPGMTRAKFSSPSSLHRLTGEKDPHEDASIAFSKEICNYLKKAIVLKKYSELIVVAEPKMFGRLKMHLGKPVVNKTEWISKDLGKISDNQLAKVLGFDLNEEHYQHSNRTLSS